VKITNLKVQFLNVIQISLLLLFFFGANHIHHYSYAKKHILIIVLLITTMIRIPFPSYIKSSLLISLNSPPPTDSILVNFSKFQLNTWYIFTLRIVYYSSPLIRGKVSFHFYFICLNSMSLFNSTTVFTKLLPRTHYVCYNI